MSYCRFSSDDYQCDVYVYESKDGYEVHIASSRYVFSEPLPPPETPNTPESFERHKRINEIVGKSKTEPITLPFAGESHTIETAIDCAYVLIELKSIGYNVPQYAIDRLLSEAV